MYKTDHTYLKQEPCCRKELTVNGSIDAINDCQLYFHFDAISDVITKRKQKFLNNYQSSENLLCSVVCST